MLKKLKQIYRYLQYEITGRVKHLKPNFKCNKLWYGNTYGGFYACPDIINKNSIVYSFGIGEDISFDLSIIMKHQCKVFGFDPTPKSIRWLTNQKLPSLFVFQPFGIGFETGKAKFFLPKNPNHVSGSIIAQDNVLSDNFVEVQLKTLKDIMIEFGHEKIDLLKMDIEGSEYKVIDNILESNIIIDQLLVEFHDRFFDENEEKSKDVVEKLKKNGYSIFAVSSSYEEVSFIRKDVLFPSYKI